jgi:hypothetical protein
LLFSTQTDPGGIDCRRISAPGAGRSRLSSGLPSSENRKPFHEDIVMNGPLRCRVGYTLVASLASALALVTGVSATQRSTFQPRVTPAETGCSLEERRAALREIQEQVLAAVPERLDSLEKAIQPGGPLAGWGLGHGYVVLAGSGAVGVDNIKAKEPVPQLLLYAPSPASKPRDWLDFDGPDNPYRLVGWAYIAPYQPGSPPSKRCIAPAEWFVHEAGWHLRDGGMQLTPGAKTEPPRPAHLDVHMWHPEIWDIHVWRGDTGTPTIAFANPKAPSAGRVLPDLAFYYLVDGAKRPPIVTEAKPKPKLERDSTQD